MKPDYEQTSDRDLIRMLMCLLAASVCLLIATAVV